MVNLPREEGKTTVNLPRNENKKKKETWAVGCQTDSCLPSMFAAMGQCHFPDAATIIDGVIVEDNVDDEFEGDEQGRQP